MSTYYCLITNAGLAKLAAAQASGTPVTLSQFAVGDSGGVFYEPLATQLTLVSEEWRGAINRVFVSPNEATRIVVEALIPASVGGFDIREAGIIDADGDLFAVGKYPLTNKPAPGSGSEKDLYVRMILQVSNAATVTQTIDPSVVTLTQAALDALDWKNSCRAGTTGNVALSGGAPSTVDGVALAVNDRVLVKNQTTASQNGIYRVQTVGTGSNGTWVRATDADSAFDVTANLVVAVEQGTVNADSIWVLTTDGPITLGTTALTFACVYGQQDKASNHISLDNGHGGQTPKTLSGSTTNSLDASGHTHAISAASETVKGAVELATAAETTAGTDNTRAVHPAGLKVELDKKAPLASPALTGTPTAPTAPADTNTFQVATTAFAYGVASKAANGYQELPSGLIIQWGAYSGGAGSWPIAFPNAALAVADATNVGGSGVTDEWAINSSGYSVTTDGNGGFYIAIGH